MFFPRRSGESTPRYLNARVGLFFLAAGVWLAGAVAGNRMVTGIAIGVAVFAIVLGLVARRME